MVVRTKQFPNTVIAKEEANILNYKNYNNNNNNRLIFHLITDKNASTKF